MQPIVVVGSTKTSRSGRGASSGGKVAKVNPKGNYTIHSFHPAFPLEAPVMTFISFDPGKISFSIRLERRHNVAPGSLCSKIESLAQSKHVLPYQRVSTRKGTKSTLISSVFEILDTYIRFAGGSVDIALIERQMEQNTSMMCLKTMIISYFLLRHPQIFVVEISSKLKGKNLGAPPGIDRPELKAWGEREAISLAQARGDNWFLTYISTMLEIIEKRKGRNLTTAPPGLKTADERKARGEKEALVIAQQRGDPWFLLYVTTQLTNKSEIKIDDDTDNLIQLEALCVEAGYSLTDRRVTLATVTLFQHKNRLPAVAGIELVSTGKIEGKKRQHTIAPLKPSTTPRSKASVFDSSSTDDEESNTDYWIDSISSDD